MRRGRTASAQDLGQMSCNWKEGKGGLSWRPGSAAGQWCELPAPSLSIHHAVRSEKGMPCLGMLSTQWPSWCVRGALNTYPLLTESGCDPCRGHNLLKGPQLNSQEHIFTNARKARRKAAQLVSLLNCEFQDPDMIQIYTWW